MTNPFGLNAQKCRSCSTTFYCGKGITMDFCSKNCENEFPFLIASQDLDPISTSEEETWVIHDFKIDIKYKQDCECGADKCGFPKHSDYCPKYKE